MPQELLVVQAWCEALKVGEESSGSLIHKVEAHLVDMVFPPRSGLL
jgi:hypothetical protein